MNTLIKKSWFPYLALSIGMFCIGISPIFTRLAAISGPVIAFYRTLIAVIILIPIWLSKSNAKYDKTGILLAMLAGAFFAFDIAMWNVSLFHTLAATSTLLANLAPVWVGFGTLYILREKLRNNYWKGLFITFIGVFIILGLKNIQHFDIGLGNLLAIGASIFYAGYLLVTQKSRTRIDTISFTTIVVISCSVILFILCLLLNENMTKISHQSWTYIIALGVISHAGGWLSINYALGHIKASVASVTLLGQPVIAAILAMFILDEWLNFWQIIGGIIVLVGIYLVNKK